MFIYLSISLTLFISLSFKGGGRGETYEMKGTDEDMNENKKGVRFLFFSTRQYGNFKLWYYSKTLNFESRSPKPFYTLPWNRAGMCWIQLKVLYINVETAVVYTHEYPIKLPMFVLDQMSKLKDPCPPIKNCITITWSSKKKSTILRSSTL